VSSVPIRIIEAAFGSNVNVDPGSWTDITTWVKDAKSKRGRQHFLGRFDPGTMDLQLDNRDRRFDPTNTSSPYNPNVVPMTPVRLRASWNLLTKNQASLETNTTGWAALTNCAIAQTAAQALDGTKSLSLTASAGGTMDATTSTGTSGIAVTPGQIYSALAYFRTAVTARACLVAIAWYTAAGTFISESAGATANDTSAGWTQANVSAAAPATAAFAAVRVRVNAAAAAEVHYVDEIGLFPAPSITVWDRGSGGADAYGVFRGFVEGWEQDWQDSLTTEVPLKVIDAFKYLNYARLPADVMSVQMLSESSILWWRLNDIEGSAVAGDSSGYSNPSTGVFGASFGQPGLLPYSSATAVVMSGVSPNYLVAPAAAAPYTISGGEPWSFSLLCWFETTATHNMDLFRGGDYLGGKGYFYVQIGSTGVIFFEVLDVTGSPISLFGQLQSPKSYNDGQPHRVAACWTFGAPGQATLYVDGVAVAQAAGVSTTINVPQVPFYVGGTPHFSNSFVGTIQDVAHVQHDLGAADALADYQAGWTPWAGDLSGTRVGRILDAISWPSALRSLDAGNSALGPTSLEKANALPYLQEVENSEFGKLFVAPDGTIALQQRQRPILPPNNTSKATFADDGTGLPYELAGTTRLTLDDADVYNKADVQRQGGAVQSVSDATSQARYGVRNTPSDTNLMISSDGEALDRGNWEISHFKNPIARIPAIRVKPNADPGNIFPKVLGLEIGDRITIKRTPAGGGSTFTQDAIIEGIAHDVTVDDWTTTYSLFAAEVGSYLVLDDATLGTLDSGHLVGY